MTSRRIGALGSILAVAVVACWRGGFRRQQPGRREVVADRVRGGRRGRGNQLHHPEKRLAAAKLVKQGKVITLGMPYSNHMPLVPGRTFALSIPGAPTHGPLNWPGDNFDQTFMDELVTAEIGQVGTQFDGLAHPMIRIHGVQGMADDNYFYNGVRLSEVLSPEASRNSAPKTLGRSSRAAS